MQRLIKKSYQTVVVIIFLCSLAAVFGFFAQGVLAQASLGLEVPASTGLGTSDLKELVVNIIRIALGFLGLVAVIIIIYGGYTWMTAGGNEDKVSSAKKILVNAVIGLVIIFVSYAITTFVINSLIEATGAG